MSAILKSETEALADELDLDGAVFYLRTKGMIISKQTLYNKLNQGKGPRRMKVSGRLRFKRTDLEVWRKKETEVIEAYR